VGPQPAAPLAHAAWLLHAVVAECSMAANSQRESARYCRIRAVMSASRLVHGMGTYRAVLLTTDRHPSAGSDSPRSVAQRARTSAHPTGGTQLVESPRIATDST
jgi:hypothetical protein